MDTFSIEDVKNSNRPDFHLHATECNVQLIQYYWRSEQLRDHLDNSHPYILTMKAYSFIPFILY